MRIDRWLVHRVLWAPRSTSVTAGTKGDPLYLPQRPLRCRLEKEHRLVRTADGREVVTSHKLMCAEPRVALRDSFWFPALLGEPADDVSSMDAARSPVMIDTATNRTGVSGLVLVRF